MDGYEILHSMKTQRDGINELRQLSPGTPEFRSWQRGTKNALERCFGNHSNYVTAFSKIDYRLLTSSSNTPDSVFQLVYLKGLDAAQVLLQTIIDRYKEYDDGNDSAPGPASVAAAASAPVPPVTADTISFANTGRSAAVPNTNAERTDNVNGSKVHGKINGNDAGVSAKTETSPAPQSETLSLIELICLRFNTVSRQLRDRHDHRPSLEIEDEYDVQDLFLALLKLHFPNARSEEWVPEYAAGSSKRDNLIESAGIVIDVKKTSSSLKPPDLRMQISADLLHYGAQPYCKMLVCFIYDPEGRIGNPEAMEKELEALSAQLPLKVIIAPKGA